MIRDVSPGYGIAYTRPHRLGPLMYAIGICQGLGPDGLGVDLSEHEAEEATNISQWNDGMDARVWENGTLRDIYPWNLVTRRHLERKICGTTLERWIKEDTRHGSLVPIDRELVLWEVGQTDIPAVRQAAGDARLIFRPEGVG